MQEINGFRCLSMQEINGFRCLSMQEINGFRCHSNTTFTIRFSMHGYGILWRVNASNYLHRKYYYKSNFEYHVKLKDTSSFEFEWAATNRLYSIYFAIQALWKTAIFIGHWHSLPLDLDICKHGKWRLIIWRDGGLNLPFNACFMESSSTQIIR
jgi:hypothetical protein